MECHVYFNPKRDSIQAFKDPPSWIGPDFVFLGAFIFDKMTEPDHHSILAWTLPRLKLLGIPHNNSLTITNYASHAYWGNPPYE